MKSHRLVFDDAEGLVWFVTEQECDPIIEHNKQLQAEPQKRAGAFHHVGHIPDIWMLKWWDEEYERGHRMTWMGEEHMRIVWRKLQDPDFRWLKTTNRQL